MQKFSFLAYSQHSSSLHQRYVFNIIEKVQRAMCPTSRDVSQFGRAMIRSIVPRILKTDERGKRVEKEERHVGERMKRIVIRFETHPTRTIWNGRRSRLGAMVSQLNQPFYLAVDNAPPVCIDCSSHARNLDPLFLRGLSVARFFFLVVPYSSVIDRPPREAGRETASSRSGPTFLPFPRVKSGQRMDDFFEYTVLGCIFRRRPWMEITRSNALGTPADWYQPSRCRTVTWVTREVMLAVALLLVKRKNSIKGDDSMSVNNDLMLF